MEKFISNLKYAAKNVFFHLNEFIAFFIAVFLIQVAFGVVGFSYVNNNAIDYEYAKEDDSYHIELRNLNSAQYYAFVNDNRYSNRKEDKIYEIVNSVQRNESSVDNTRYDIFIKFVDENPLKNYKTFNSRYSKLLAENSDGLYSVELSDMMEYHNNVWSNRWVYILSVVILTAVSLFLMVTLFGYRLNLFKFTYGIYLTFGANYRKLVSSSFWEMLLVTLTTMIPACAVSVMLSMFIYRNVTFVFEASVLIITAVMSTLVTTLSVLGPMKLLAASTPVKALRAEDNSNYVVSPEVSSKAFFSKFPKNYIIGTFIRYRKYLTKLVLCGLVFGLAYIGGISFSHLYGEYLDYNRPSFSLDFYGVDNYFTDEVREKLLSIDGIVDVRQVEESSALKVNSHVLLPKGKTTVWADTFSVNANGGEYSVTNSVTYRPLDSSMADYLSENYEIEGDIHACVGNDDMIVISDGRYNQKVYKLKPGDVIYVATYIANEKCIDTIESGEEYLRQQLEHNRYSYRKYTVGAVIKDMPTGDKTPVYLSPVDYSVVAKSLPRYYQADIYIDTDLTIEEKSAVLDNIRTYTDSIGGISVEENVNADINKMNDKNFYDFIIILSVIVLIIMPVLIMFAQVLFYLKRDTEMYVLEAYGATKNEIRSLFLGDGALIAIVSCIIYTVLSFIVVYVLNRIANVLFMYPGFDFEMPWLQFIFGLIITCLVSLLSSVIPYFAYQKKKKELLSSVTGEV